MNQPAYCTYVHCRPDGLPFYAGKGVLGRARDFSPSRRPVHHQNIVKKYGRDNIRICVFLCQSEQDALISEVALIKVLREEGFPLINRTDGGEGTSGRAPSKAQLEGLAKGRGVAHFNRMSSESKQRIYAGLSRGRSKLKTNPAFLKHLETLKEIGKNNFRDILERNTRKIVCAECGKEKIVSNYRAKCCSRRCEQRNRRAREKMVNAGN